MVWSGLEGAYHPPEPHKWKVGLWAEPSHIRISQVIVEWSQPILIRLRVVGKETRPFGQ